MAYSGLSILGVYKQILDEGNVLSFKASGYSMSPFIENGETINVKKAETSRLGLGDIIFYFDDNGGLFVHRIIKRVRRKEGVNFLAKGDSLSFPDTNFIYPENILGKVVAVKKNNTVISFESGFLRVASLMYAKLLPFSKYAYKLIKKLK